MSKFQVGDVVRVNGSIAVSYGAGKVLIGHIGTITEIDDDNVDVPILVLFAREFDLEASGHYDNQFYFKLQELDKIE